jgi:hypothetical protein
MADKVYISGKRSGLTRDEVRMNFDKSARELANSGYVVINTVELQLTQPEIVGILKDCSYIYMQKNWKDSIVARFEQAIAEELGMVILYEDDVPDLGC